MEESEACERCEQLHVHIMYACIPSRRGVSCERPFKRDVIYLEVHEEFLTCHTVVVRQSLFTTMPPTQGKLTTSCGGFTWNALRPEIAQHGRARWTWWVGTVEARNDKIARYGSAEREHLSPCIHTADVCSFVFAQGTHCDSKSHFPRMPVISQVLNSEVVLTIPPMFMFCAHSAK